MKKNFLAFNLIVLMLLCVASSSQANPFPLNAKRILFIGDSITHAGHYVNLIETELRLQNVQPMPEIINIGLGSETCSGLSEPEHPFPRPDVNERLERALKKIKPDVVVACYGMNDAIYHPFSEERFQAYQIGIHNVIATVHNHGAKIILLTPPPFDAIPLKGKGKLLPAGQDKYAYFAMYENYDNVLKRYGQWIMKQNDDAEMLINIHAPLTAYVAENRKKNPEFTISPDGIHPNSEGHRVMAQTILKAWGVESFIEPSAELQKLMTQRGKLLHDAWLSDIGHKHPRIRAGLPLEEALQKANDLNQKIVPLVEQGRKPVISKRLSTAGTIHQIHYPAIFQEEELKLFVDYYLWIPEGVQKIRGIIVHQHGCGPGSSSSGQTAADDLHWQALAKKWDCALLGSSYEPRKGVNCRLWCDARNGSDKRFLQALNHYSESTGHSEIATAPWCIWGHSGGGFWASLMQTKHPQRIVAIWLQSGTAFGYWTKGDIEVPEISEAAYQVPVMGNPGLKEKGHKRFKSAWDGTTAMRKAYLAKGAPFFEFAPDPNTAHECGNSRYLSIPFFDFWLAHRLPETAGNSYPKLNPTTDALADWDREMKPKLEEFIKTGAVSDNTPPPAPTNIQTKRLEDGSVQISWSAEADFESGIRAFRIERNGKPIAQVPETPKNNFGRPLFQNLSYSDSPVKPLPEMTFIDKSAPKGKLPNYKVRTINSVEMLSP